MSLFVGDISKSRRNLDTAEECPDIDLDGQSLEIVDKICHPGETTELQWVQLKAF